MAENLSVGTSVEMTDIYGQKLAGYVTIIPANNDGQYKVQVRQKWDHLPEGGQGWVEAASSSPTDFPVERVKQSAASRGATWAK